MKEGGFQFYVIMGWRLGYVLPWVTKGGGEMGKNTIFALRNLWTDSKKIN